MSLSEQIQRVDGSQNDIIKALAQSYGISADGLKIDQVASAVKSSQKFKQDGLLSAATAALFGLGPDSVPDDGFAYLGKYAQHWWRRRAITYVPVLAAAEEISIIQIGSQSSALDVPYSSELSITSLTEFDLKSPTNLSLSYSTHEQGNTLKGKYFRTHKNFGGELISEAIFYMAPDADNVRRVSGTGYSVVGTAAKVSIATQYGKDYEYVQSSDRHTYPDSGEQDGYEYQYLGVPFENAVGAPKIETGSYVGTGTYGSSNPNTITLGIDPKLLFISGGGTTAPITMVITSSTQPLGCLSSGQSVSTLSYVTAVLGKETKWYSTGNENAQANKARESYTYIALG